MKPPLLLAAHGTRDQAGVAAFNALAERVGGLAAGDGTRVAGGFIELSPPPLREAVATLVNGTQAHLANGTPAHLATNGTPAHLANGTLANLVAVPLMLSAAGHAKGDIPAALARERTRHPGLRWTYARPLGPHPALLDLLAARIAAVAGDGGGCQGGRPPVASPAPAVLVVGPASPAPDATADVVRPPGCCGRAASTRSPRPPSSRWPGPMCSRAWSGAACSARGRSWWPGISCFPACCPTGWPLAPASTPPRIPTWTSGAPTCSATATRSPRWSTSGTTRRCQETSG